MCLLRRTLIQRPSPAVKESYKREAYSHSNIHVRSWKQCQTRAAVGPILQRKVFWDWNTGSANDFAVVSGAVNDIPHGYFFFGSLSSGKVKETRLVQHCIDRLSNTREKGILRSLADNCVSLRHFGNYPEKSGREADRPGASCTPRARGRSKEEISFDFHCYSFIIISVAVVQR